MTKNFRTGIFELVVSIFLLFVLNDIRWFFLFVFTSILYKLNYMRALIRVSNSELKFKLNHLIDHFNIDIDLKKAENSEDLQSDFQTIYK